ncbi:MAG: hypothetical protein OEV78_12035 [Spirochaetia bacterium]|nr:hypothetical protein [Spirochaetia bacterium]
MNTRIKILFTGLFITAAVFTSCKGDTNTADLLNGKFINALSDTTPPNILTPADGSVTGLSVVLVWTSKAGAANYIIDVATDSSFSNTIAGSPFNVTAPSTTYSLALTVGNRYYWRVRADTTASGQYGQAHFDAMDSSIYVYCPSTVVTCSDIGAIGNKAVPYQTIMGGLAAAVRLGINTVKVASRGGATAYYETLFLRDGVNLAGGYNAATWTQDKINNQSIVASTNTLVVYGQNIFSNTLVEGFDFRNLSTGQTNSIGVDLQFCLNQLTIQNNTISGGTPGKGGSAYAVFTANASPNILYNTINGGSGGGFSMGINHASGTITVSNNIINGGSGTNSYGINISNGAIITNISANTINGGTGTNSYGIYNNSGAITSMFNNTINGGSGGTASYGINNSGSIATLSNNAIYGGGGTSSYGIFMDLMGGGMITTLSNNFINGGTGTSSYGVYNCKTITNAVANVINGGSGTTSYGIYNYSIFALSNNTINGGSGTTSYGIYNLVSINHFSNNIIFSIGKNNTRYAFYEVSTNSSPSEIINNNIFDSGSGGKFYFYADMPAALTTGTTCINAAATTDTTRNCYNLISNVNTASITTGGIATTAQGNINIPNTANQLFVNAPVMYDTTIDGPDANSTYDGTTTTIEVGACDVDLRYGTNGVPVPTQYIEYNNDGIARQITAINCVAATAGPPAVAAASIITFTPALATASEVGVQITLWGANGANMTEDYHLKTATTTATCNALFGGVNMAVLIGGFPSADYDGIARTAVLPPFATAPASNCNTWTANTGAAGWSMGAFERD